MRNRQQAHGLSHRGGHLLALLVCLSAGLASACSELRQFTASLPTRNNRPAVSIPPYAKESLNLPTMEHYVNRLAQPLIEVAQREHPGLGSVRITVLKTSRVHSAANLGAPEILITRGLLNVLASEAELSCIIAHELGHKVWAHNEGSARTGPGAARQREGDADVFGALLCQRAGYDPSVLVDVLERLAAFLRVVPGQWQAEAAAEAKVLTQRATALRALFSQKGLVPSHGIRRDKEYRRQLATLQGITSNEPVLNAITPGGSEAIRRRLQALQNDLSGYAARRQPLPPGRFYEVMEELSRIARGLGWKPLRHSFPSAAVPDAQSIAGFLRALLNQDSALSSVDPMAAQVEASLALIGRIGVGFIPVVNDVVDLYEFMRGREFGSGRLLSPGERTLSAAGVLIGNGRLYREAAQGIASALRVAQRTSNVCDPALVGAERLLARAEQVADERQAVGRPRAALHKDKVVLGTYPKYLEKADELNARRFDVPADVWKKMSEGERWTANKKFLDRAIARSDEFVLAGPVNDIDKVTGTFRKELDYLIEQGYRLSEDGTRMIKDIP